MQKVRRLGALSLAAVLWPAPFPPSALAQSYAGPRAAPAPATIVLAASPGLAAIPAFARPSELPVAAAAPAPAAATALPAPSAAASLAAAGDVSPASAAEARAESARAFDGAEAGAFSADELSDLEEAAQNGHDVELLARGDGRRVVLMGERHNTSAASAAAALQAKRHFPYRGLESYDPSRSIGGRLMTGLVVPLVRAGDFIRTLGRVRPRSAIADAAIEDHVGSMSPDERRDLRERLDAMSEGELAGNLPGTGVSYRRISAMLREAASTEGAPRRSFDLEEGHRPDLAEQVLAAALPALYVGALSWTLCSWLPQYPVVAAVKNAGMAVTAFLAWNAMIGGLLSDHLERRPWMRAAFPFGRYPYVNGLLRARDETMAANVARAFAANPEVDRLLVLVGKAHVPGLKALLTSRYGFRSAEEPRP